MAQLPLVEVVRCDDTDQAVLDRGFAFVKSIGKVPLECSSSPGFVVNRVLAPYMAEAMHLIDEGVRAGNDRSSAAENFGMPMGPVELLDSVGLDVSQHVSEVLGAAFGRSAPPVSTKMVENEQFGRKSGQGFYTWQDGKAVKPQPASDAIPEDHDGSPDAAAW